MPTILYEIVTHPSCTTQRDAILAMLGTVGAERAKFVYQHQGLWAPHRDTVNPTDPWISLAPADGGFDTPWTGADRVTSQTAATTVQRRGLFELLDYAGGIPAWHAAITRPNIEFWRAYFEANESAEVAAKLADPETCDLHFVLDEESMSHYSADLSDTTFDDFYDLGGFSDEAVARATFEATLVDFYTGAIAEWRALFPVATFSFPYLIGQQIYNLDDSDPANGGDVLNSGTSNTGRTRRREIEWQLGLRKHSTDAEYDAAAGSKFGWMGAIIKALDEADCETYAQIGESVTETPGTDECRTLTSKFYYGLTGNLMRLVKGRYNKPLRHWISVRYPPGAPSKVDIGLNALDCEGLVSAGVAAGAEIGLWIDCGVNGGTTGADAAVDGVTNILPFLARLS